VAAHTASSGSNKKIQTNGHHILTLWRLEPKVHINEIKKLQDILGCYAVYFDD